jgi:hypothetical protein
MFYIYDLFAFVNNILTRESSADYKTRTLQDLVLIM